MNRDDDLKSGQIAHLDKDSSNNCESNLAFLCFDHHDKFDSRTSQSKNLTKSEVERYRDELHKNFAPWGSVIEGTEYLLNLYAASIGPEDVARTLIKVGKKFTAFPLFQIKLALTESNVELMDGDLAIPLLYILDSLASWGIVKFEFEEPGQNSRLFRFQIEHPNPKADQALLDAVEKLNPDTL